MDPGFLLSFDRSGFTLVLLAILLILLLTATWVFGFRSLAGLGKWRRLFSLILRSIVIVVLFAALAKTQWQKSTDKLTVIYLLDQSESIPSDKRDFMLNYVFEEVANHRRDQKQDMAGVIVFGGNAKIESAPYDGDLPLIGRVESAFDLKTGATSLEAALKLAKASFPEDTARRVVIISDGNENIGDATAVAQSMADDGIGIDVIPIELLAESEVSVDKIVIPSDIRKGQAFETRVVLTNDSQPTEENPAGTVSGKLRITAENGSNRRAGFGAADRPRTW